MRKFFILSSFVALSLLGASCDKSELNSAEENRMVATMGNIIFSIEDNSFPTRSTSAGTDNYLNKVEIMVFNKATGQCVGSGSKTINSTSGSVDVQGVPLNMEVECVAVANYNGSITTLASADAVRAAVVDLADYKDNCIPMYGTVTKTFTAQDKSSAISLKRAASKIEVQKISASFNTGMAALTTTLKQMYVYKAPSKYTLGLTAPASQNYRHSDGYSSSDASSLGTAATLIGETGLNGNLSNNASVQTPHYFWCCPDATGVTYLTIAVEIDGSTYYYGVNFPVLAPNTKYVVTDMILKGYGNPNPPGIVDKDAVSLSITVEDWASGSSQPYTF